VFTQKPKKMQAFYKKHTELVSKINQKKTQKFYFAAYIQG
jgi:hypothetical protein